MLVAYCPDYGHLAKLGHPADSSKALWIDLYRSFSSESDAVTRLDLTVPSLADILEGVGRGLDEVPSGIYQNGTQGLRADLLQTALERVGREGDLLGRVRLGFLTVKRAVSVFGQPLADRPDVGLRPLVKGLMRDLQALEVNAEFLGRRLALTSDATLGMINLSQNATVRIVSVVAAMFLPPTLIASAYGMNFAQMPELAHPLGYPMALALMLASVVGTYLFFKRKRWL